MTEALAEVAQWLQDARSVLVLTGAGISAESGIPTFRGKDGWWKNHDPMELASPEGFARNPALVWEWYAYRYHLVEKAQPNPGHHAIAHLEERTPAFLLLTQNVDGLHRRAGSKNVHEIHGSIQRMRCTRTGKIYHPTDVPIEPPFPLKTPDGDLLRPDVVWFGETIRMDAAEAVEDFLATHHPDVCLLIGTSALFAYIQSWSLRAKYAGARLVEINAERSTLSGMADAFIQQQAGTALPQLVEALT
ncbi:NAD-dependent deacylase [bacterium]|nr:NAD-dependent deacylase [bacterium]